MLRIGARVRPQPDEHNAAAHITGSGVFVFLQETSWIKANLKGKNMFPFNEGPSLYPSSD